MMRWMFGHSLQINSPYDFRPGLMRQAVVSFAHRQINWVGVAVEGRVGDGYKA